MQSLRLWRRSSCALTVLLVGASAVAGGPRVSDAQQPWRDSLHAALIGRVTDSTGLGLTGADIRVLGSESLRATSGDSGAFQLVDLPIGVVVFSVRRLGYTAATFTANLRGGKTHRARFVLSTSPVPLPVVTVTDTANRSHWLDEFETRRNGERGRFITRQDIERSSARTATDLVRNVAGLRVTGNGSAIGQRVTTTRGAGARACVPQLYVHDTPYSGTLDDFGVEDIEAMEIYVGISEVPPELNRTMRTVDARGRSTIGAPCAVIVVWTRDPRGRP